MTWGQVLLLRFPEDIALSVPFPPDIPPCALRSSPATHLPSLPRFRYGSSLS